MLGVLSLIFLDAFSSILLMLLIAVYCVSSDNSIQSIGAASI